MGVYIKGMEMPTDCHNCPLGFGGGCYCGTSADEYMCPDHGRADWCPLVPVPKHGRCIDADALEEYTDDRYSLGEIGRRERDNIVDALRYNAPTIIPASEEGE